ncbi:MAG: NEW3 domain-containing protein, partial [Candidatus Nanohalobium sp.]
MLLLILIILSVSSIATATSVELNTATELNKGAFNNTTVESGDLRIKYNYSNISKTGFYDEDIKFQLQQEMVVNASPNGAGWSSNPTDTGTNKNPPYSNKWHEQDNNGDSDQQTYYSGGTSYTPDSNDFFVTWVWPVAGSAPPWHMFQFHGWKRRIQTGGSSCRWSPCNLTDIQEPTPGQWSAFVMREEDTNSDLTGASIDGIAYTHPGDSTSHAYYDSGLFVENPKVREGFFTQASYTSDRISRNELKSWTTLEVDATNVSGTESNATAVFQALENGTTKVIGEQVIDLSEGLNNYSLSVPATADSRVIFNGSSNTNRTWKVNSFEVFFQPGLKINKTITATNYSDRHRFNVSSVAKHASSDNKISSCRVYIKDQKDFGSFQKLSGSMVDGNHADLNTGYSGSKLASCNASIDSSLNGVEVGEKISYYIEFEADSGYTRKTTIKTNTVPNRRPSVVTTSQDPLGNSHAFNFSAIGFDIDEGADEINSTSYIKVDDVDNSLPDSDLSSPRKKGNLNQTFNSSEDYASLNASVSNTLFSEFSVNEEIEIWAVFRDVAVETATTSRYTYTIPNHEPYITSNSINFTDSIDSHAFRISVNSSDPDGDSDLDSCTVHAYDQDGNSYALNGNLDKSTAGNKKASCSYSSVNSSLKGFNPGETIYTQVEFSDKYGGAVNTSIFTHDIPNRAPGKPSSVQFINMEGNRTRLIDHSPKINWTNPTDAENDTITIKAFTEQSIVPDNLDNNLSFTGTGNNSFQLGQNVNLIDGDSYNVTLKACDEYGKCSSPTDNLEFRMNQEPQILSAGVNASSPNAGDDLKITADISDLDTITETNFTVRNLNTSNIVVNNSDDSGPWNSSVFNANDSTSYNWSLISSDGYETSQASGQFKVGNQIPSISKEITKDRITGTHLFNVSAVASDSNDNDLVNFTVTLSDGTNSVTEGPQSVDRTYPGKGKASANFTVNSSKYGWMDVGESITVEISFSDDSDSTASTSNSFTVPNSRPVIDSLGLSNNPLTTENLDPNITAGDPEDGIVKKEYEWYINGKAAGISSSTLDSSETAESENWSVRVRVRDEYGKWSKWNQTENVTIANSNPEILQEVQFDDIGGQHAFRVNATALDDNGQSDIQSCEVIYSNSTGTTNTSDIEALTGYGGVNELKCEGVISAENQSWLEPKEDLNVSIRVTDDNSSTVTTTEREKTVSNSRPSISLDTPVNQSNFSSSSVNFSWSASDPEGDNLIYVFRAFNSTGEKIKQEKINSRSKSFSFEDSRIDWRVEAFDQYSGENLSSVMSKTRQITVDTTPPEPVSTGINVVNSSNSTPTGDQSVTCYSRWTDNSKQWKSSSLLYNAEIYENSTSSTHDISIADRWVNYTISDPKAGRVSCEFSVSDKIGNRNSTNLSFEVRDVTRPDVSGIRQSPTDQASLDPNTTVDVNVTATDNLEIANYSLEYRKEGGSWKDGNVSRDGDLLIGNFSTGEEGNFTYRFTLNDTYGNTERVNDTVEIRWDHDWTLSPSTYDGTTTLKQNLIQYQPVTITNSGDFNKTFNITKSIPASSSNLNLSLNVTNTTLRPEETLTIDLNASLSENSSKSSEGNYNFEIKVKSNNSRSTSSKKITGDALFTRDTPYLTLSSFSTPSSITKGQEKEFTYSIKNEGAEKAVNTSLSVELPEKWELTEGYTNEKGNISIGGSKLLTFKAKPAKKSKNGTRTIKITATEASRSFTEKFPIAVIQEQTPIVKEDTTVVAGGSGGSSGGLTRQQQIEQVSDQIFNQTQSFELVRGQDQNFTVSITNPTRYNLSNVSIEASGFRTQYLNLKTEHISKLKVNETQNITVAITAPDFFASSSFTINFDISGVG